MSAINWQLVAVSAIGLRPVAFILEPDNGDQIQGLVSVEARATGGYARVFCYDSDLGWEWYVTYGDASSRGCVGTLEEAKECALHMLKALLADRQTQLPPPPQTPPVRIIKDGDTSTEH